MVWWAVIYGPRMANVGMCFDRSLPAAFVVEVAEALEAADVDQLWVIEDCFYTAGISLAVTALARTERLTVGLGILPAVARNPAITAMELATMANLAPGRLLAGIGHGVQEWMDQMGARHGVAAHRARRGDHGGTPAAARRVGDVRRCARDDAQRRTRCTTGPGTAGAGRRARARNRSLSPGALPTVSCSPRGLGRRTSGSRSTLQEPLTRSGCRCSLRSESMTTLRPPVRIMAPFVCGMLDDGGPAVLAHPHIDEILERHRERGVDGIADMPADWWIELGAIGTFDDAVRHAEALVDAGADGCDLLPRPHRGVGARGSRSRHPPRRCPPLTPGSEICGSARWRRDPAHRNLWSSGAVTNVADRPAGDRPAFSVRWEG